MYKLLELINTLNEGAIEYPSDHKPGVRVPKGGSMCANCEYWKEEGNQCLNKYWEQWAETKKIPYPANEYCCNWWEQK